MVNCPECSGPISAGVIDVKGVGYHPHCFFCKKCAEKLKITSYREVTGKFYCNNCVDKTPSLYHAERAEKKAASDAAANKSAAISKPAAQNNEATAPVVPPHNACCIIQ